MCWFLTLAIPPGLPLPATERERYIRPTPINAVDTAFPPHWQHFDVTSGGCACGLYSPPGSDAPNPEDATDRLRERYRRKGWSPARIERALRDRDQARQHKPDRHNGPMRFREQVAEWVSAYGQICIRAHWEGREHEALPIGRRILELSVEDFLRDGFPPETVVRVHGMATNNHWRKHGTSLDE